MKKIILLFGSQFCFFLSFSYFPTFFYLFAYFLLILYILWGNSSYSFNSILFLFLSIGCIFLDLPYSGYFLLFFYLLVSFVFSCCQSYFSKKILNFFGNPQNEVIVRAGKITKKKNLQDVKVGDLVLVAKGDTCFIEGYIVRGIGHVSLKKLLGKEEVSFLKKGDFIFCGSVNLDSDFWVRVSVPYCDTIFSRFQQMLFCKEHLSYMNSVFHYWNVTLIHIVFLFLAFFVLVYQFHLHALQYGLMILFILFFDFENIFFIREQLALLYLQRKGIYTFHRFKLRRLAGAKNFIFTKTRVLTLGKFTVTDISGNQEKRLLEVLAYAEYYCQNEIGKCIHEYCQEKVLVDSSLISNYQEFPNGVSVVVHGKRYLVGNYHFMLENGITVEKELVVGTNLYVSIDSNFLGVVTLSDQMKMTVKEEISKLRKLGLSHITTFSKDNETITRAVSNALGIYDCYSELTYQDRDFWIQYLKDIYGVPQAYISDEECNYPVEIKIAFTTDTSKRGDFILVSRDFSKISFLYSFSRNYVSSIRGLILLEIFFKLVLLFLLLWIRDILVLGGIMLGGVAIFLLTVLPFVFDRKGE